MTQRNWRTSHEDGPLGLAVRLAIMTGAFTGGAIVLWAICMIVFGLLGWSH